MSPSQAWGSKQAQQIQPPDTILRHCTRGEMSTHLDDLKLHTLICLWALEAVTDGLHKPIDQPLPWSAAVCGIAGDVAIG